MSFPERSNKTDFQFHLINIKNICEDYKLIHEINEFPLEKDSFYSRRDNSGWWMVTKQIVFRHYIKEYLDILGKRKMKLFFVDPLSNSGMNKITKVNARDQFIFPGSSINAALISQKNSYNFSEIYSNDYKSENRNLLLHRLESMKINFSPFPKINIDNSNDKIDSNEWLIQIFMEINNKEKFWNYLLIIDNEGMDITFETIKKIRTIHDYGDLIITFQDAGIKRNLGLAPEKIEKFFGKKIPKSTKKENLIEIYKNQLYKIGIGKIEELKIYSETGFYYTLLFCCRKQVSGAWLEMIRYYRNKRFQYWNDKDVKNIWDVVTGRINPLC